MFDEYMQHQIELLLRGRLELEFGEERGRRQLDLKPHVRLLRRAAGPAGVVRRPAGVGRNTARGAWRSDASVKIGRGLGERGEVYVQGFNVLNRANYVAFSGNVQSPFFGRPTSAAPARRIELGVQIGF